MDHKAFLSTLTASQRETLTARNNIDGLRHFMAHFGMITLFGLWVYLAAPLWPVVLFLQGVLLVFLFTLLHETTHKTPFQSDRLNTVVGHICGFLLILPATWFRYFHLAHHRHTQDPDKDPELQDGKPENWRDYVVHISGVPVWISQIKSLVSTLTGAAQRDYVPVGRIADVRREAGLYALGYGALLGLSIWQGTLVLFWIWLLPMLIGQPVLRLYLLAEHGRCPTVANMLENTRTTYTNRLVRAMAWNMPYHTEHHSYPAVPFHKLPALHALMKSHLIMTADGYAKFNKDYVQQMPE